jgi:hypothetical protein
MAEDSGGCRSPLRSHQQRVRFFPEDAERALTELREAAASVLRIFRGWGVGRGKEGNQKLKPVAKPAPYASEDDKGYATQNLLNCGPVGHPRKRADQGPPLRVGRCRRYPFDSKTLFPRLRSGQAGSAPKRSGRKRRASWPEVEKGGVGPPHSKQIGRTLGCASTGTKCGSPFDSKTRFPRLRSGQAGPAS